MAESKEDDDVILPETKDSDITSRFAEENRSATSEKTDDILALETIQPQPIVDEQKGVEEKLQGKNVLKKECGDGTDIKKEASGSTNVCEEYGPEHNFQDDCKALQSAIQSRSLEIVKHFVEDCGVEITCKDESEKTALHHAVDVEATDIVRYLVEQCGADVNRKTTDGATLLHSAVIKNTLEMVKYLVENGADVNGEKNNGWTVLHYAVSESTLAIVKYLVEQGADVNGKDTGGCTVLHTAFTRYRLEHDADVYYVAADEWPVLHAAVDADALEIIKYLVEHITLKGEINAHTLSIDIMNMAVVYNSVSLVNLMFENDIVVWRAGTFLVGGKRMSLLEWSNYLGYDEIPTILKKSVKHREKLQMLRKMNTNQLEKIDVPNLAFIAKNQFKIGDGGFSCVYVGLMKDESEVAVKRILVQSEDRTIENEKEIMNLIKTNNSPFIVNYRHFHRDDTFMYLIVDLCEETLRELVEACSIEYLQEHGRRMIKEILSGLEFLHSKRILHRDLKPSNVLVDIEGRMKLADFGISRVLNEDESTVETFAKGTPGWMPPEVIETIDKNEKGPFKRKSDVQVAGMIAFFVLTKGEHPFGSKIKRMRNILEGNAVNLRKLDDREARQFVSWLINHKIDDRPYAHEALRDSFVSGD